MPQRETTIITTGIAGSGKSYARCARFLCDEFLPEEEGNIYTNFPIDIEKMSEFVSKKTGRPATEYAERIFILPEEVKTSWIEGKTTPRDYFLNMDITGAHIALDEAHNYASCNHKVDIRNDYAYFCGELRHRKATIEFLTQNVAKLAREIDREAGQRYEIDNSESRLDPVFKIPLYDWYQLRAGFSGSYIKSIWQHTFRRSNSKWKKEVSRKYNIDPKYYPVYDSFNAPEKGGHVSDKKVKEPFQKYSLPALFAWFLSRNLGPVFKVAAIASVLIYFTMGGGGTVFAWMMSITSRSSKVVKNKETDSTYKAYLSKTPGQRSAPAAKRKTEKILATNDEKQGEDIDPEIIYLREINESLKIQNEEYITKINQGSSIVMMTQNSVIFADGLEYKKDDVIEIGLYKGMKINEIDYFRRKVKLDDGTVLTYALYKRLPEREKETEYETRIRESVQARSGKEKTTNRNTGSGKIDHAFRSGNGDTKIPSLPRAENRSLDHRQPEFGRKNDNARSHQSDSQGRTIRSGTSPRRGNNENRKPLLPRKTTP